jgi:hypothetical protein
MGEPEFHLTDDEAFKLSSAFFGVLKYFLRMRLTMSPKWAALGALCLALYNVYKPKVAAYQARMASQARMQQPGPTGSQPTDPNIVVA